MVKWVHYQYACYARKFKMNPCETNLRKAKNSTSKVSIKVHPCETNCGEIKTVQGVYKIVKSHCDFNMMDLKKLYGFLWILIFIKTRTSKIQKRATEQKIGNIILVYQILNVSEDCSVGQKFIKANCTDSEHAICLRNYTWKNLVAVCVDNIPMHGLCPVLTLAKKNGRIPFITIQMDHQSICDNCSHYYLWDVGK
ncbi:uncharacterized protein LOC134256271, partial [Saccostrea cucullata]|uniref:uncharacterized protein LOC134256271 n=1 Tax=Saccostrea cuccullata TaxID=36930 RepID=UPI002ED26174